MAMLVYLSVVSYKKGHPKNPQEPSNAGVYGLNLNRRGVLGSSK